MPNLVSIAITDAPNKVFYKAGDYFERYGMRVVANYSDGTSVDLPFYDISPSGPLSESVNHITISFMGFSAVQPITVTQVSDDGYFSNACLKSSELGGNPSINVGDASVRYRCRPIKVGKDAYEVSMTIEYCSRMTDRESDLIKGMPKGWRTNFHRFLIQDGSDSSGREIYKFIDGDGYIHSFLYDSLLGGYLDCGGRGLFLNPSERKITDIIGNSMVFDAQGRISSIFQTGGKTTIIEYNSNGLRKIYDLRKPQDYVKLSYDASSTLRWIRVFRNGVEAKIYDVIGAPGQISSIRESSDGSNRELHAFSVNDRDRVNRMVDRITGEAYRVTYEFEPENIIDYIVESVRKGYMQGGQFVEASAVFRGHFGFRQASLSVLSECHVTAEGGQDIVYFLDSKARIVSRYEVVALGRDFYSMDSVEGKRVDHLGQSRISINESVADSFSGTLNCVGGLSADDFNGSPFAKLSGYINISPCNGRAKLFFTHLGLESEPVDINPDATEVWQYFEIPFERKAQFGQILPFSSFSIRATDGSGIPIVALVADLRFKISEEPAKTVLEISGRHVNLATAIGLRFTGENGSESYLSLSDYRFTHGDLASSLMRAKRFGTAPALVSLNGGEKAAKTFGSLMAVFPGGWYIDLLDPSNLDNSVVGNGKNWYSLTSRPRSRTLLDFGTLSWSIDRRMIRPALDGSAEEEVSIKTEINYSGQTIEVTNFDGGGSRYEYFPDGTLMKETAFSSDSPDVVIYEEMRTGDSRVITEDGVTTVCSMNDDLISEIELPDSNGQAKATISYDAYREEISSVVFSTGGQTISANTCMEGASPLSLTFDDGSSSYRIESSDGGAVFKEYVMGASGYSLVSENSETVGMSSLSYHLGGGNILALAVERDSYEKPSYIYEGQSQMASFSYVASRCSPFVYQTYRINDDFCGTDISMQYDEYGLIKKVGAGRLMIEYPNKNGIDSRIYIFDGVDKYEFDTNGKAFCFHDPYDQLLFLSSNCNDGFGRPSGKTIELNGVLTEVGYFYDSRHLSRPDGFGFGCVGESYSCYESTGRIATKSSYFPSLLISRSYYYDVFGRLIGESSSRTGLYKSYSYFGSRMSSFGGNSISYDDRGRMSSFGGVSFAYDNLGNMTYRTSPGSSVSYSYVRGHLLSSVSGQASFTYNYEGKRVRKTVSGGTYHEYHYDGGRLIAEDVRNPGYRSYSRIIYFYDREGIAGFSVRGLGYATRRDFLYIKNQLGDIIGLMEGENVVAIYDYDAWGNHDVLNPDGSVNSDPSFIGNINPFRYKGYYYDVETSLYYITSRYYDPKIGRFISPDSVDYLDPSTINGLNLYAYCYNDPINYYDPSGHIVTELIAGGVAIYYLLAGLAILVIGTGVVIASQGGFKNISFDVPFEWQATWNDFSDNVSNMWSDISNWWNGLFDRNTSASSISYGTSNDVAIMEYQRKKAAPRIKCKSRKEARQKAFLKGGKRKPILHFNGPHGPHFHPDDPKFKHWHYYFEWLLWTMLNEEEDEYEY